MPKHNILMINPLSNKINLFEIDGTELTDVPIRCFVHHKVFENEIMKSWMVSEFFSGMAMTSEWPTKNAAIDAGHRAFAKMQLRDIKDIVNDRVKIYGYANTDGTERSKKNAGK